VNWLAVIVAAVIQMVLGFLWYGPLFGKTWMSLMSITPQAMSERMASGGMGKTYAWSFVGALVTAAVLGKLVGTFGATSVSDGASVGFWAWLGFVATVTLGSVLYERRPVGLYTLNNGYQLVSLAVMGAVLAVWR